MSDYSLDQFLAEVNARKQSQESEKKRKLSKELETLQTRVNDMQEMERSELVAEALGEHAFDEFLRNKRLEWDGYRTYVSPFELDRYLPLL